MRLRAVCAAPNEWTATENNAPSINSAAASAADVVFRARRTFLRAIQPDTYATTPRHPMRRRLRIAMPAGQNPDVTYGRNSPITFLLHSLNQVSRENLSPETEKCFANFPPAASCYVSTSWGSVSPSNILQPRWCSIFKAKSVHYFKL